MAARRPHLRPHDGPEVAILAVEIGKHTTPLTPTRYPGTPWGVVTFLNDHSHESLVLHPGATSGGSLGPEQYYVPPTS